MALFTAMNRFIVVVGGGVFLVVVVGGSVCWDVYLLSFRCGINTLVGCWTMLELITTFYMFIVTNGEFPI